MIFPNKKEAKFNLQLLGMNLKFDDILILLDNNNILMNALKTLVLNVMVVMTLQKSNTNISIR